jgi:putative transposase
VANLHRDGLHKLTTELAREYGIVVIEDLNVAGMLRNRRLARWIADAGFGEIRRQLAYKTRWNGGRTRRPLVPLLQNVLRLRRGESQTRLSVRTYKCTTCGLVLDRDLNAARNLAALAGKATDARSRRESSNGRGADPKTRPSGRVAVKRQPGTASAGQTGTVPPQGGTASHVLTKAS